MCCNSHINIDNYFVFFIRDFTSVILFRGFIPLNWKPPKKGKSEKLLRWVGSFNIILHRRYFLFLNLFVVFTMNIFRAHWTLKSVVIDEMKKFLVLLVCFLFIFIAQHINQSTSTSSLRLAAFFIWLWQLRFPGISETRDMSWWEDFHWILPLTKVVFIFIVLLLL